MAGFAQLEAISAQLGRVRVQIVSEPSARRRLVEDSENLDVVLEHRRASPHRAGELVQDALLLLERARLGDGELVAQLDELLRLDEQRLP